MAGELKSRIQNKLSFEREKWSSRAIVANHNLFCRFLSKLKFKQHLKQACPRADFLNYFSDIQRTVEISEADKLLEEVVITCYFTKKEDPIHGVVRSTPAIEYIAPWYHSIIKLKLRGIVIHDGLDSSFIQQYQNEFVQFREYKAGRYSIFEERWFAYYLFLSGTGIQRMFCTDANDVYITRPPFLLIDAVNVLFVGRDQANKVRKSGWIMEELNLFIKDSGYRVPKAFKFQQVYNAGVVGGNRKVMLFLISRIIELVLMTATTAHKDMSLINLIIHKYFFPKMRYQINEPVIKPGNEGDFISHKYLKSGYPINSEFKQLELSSDAYFIHK